MKKAILSIVAIAMLASCTENSRVKNFGGTGELEISPSQKFVNVTWKEEQLWVITKDRTSADTTYNTYRLQEHSSYGMLEGTYVIKETRGE
jgi:hypothetical protein